MADGGVFEAEVVLDADGSPIDRAIATIEQRISGIQGQIDKIMAGTKAAADAFGGSIQQTLNNFNKTVSTLERFQNNLQKLDPNFQKQSEINAAYAAREKQEATLANKKAQQEAQLFATMERQQLTSAQKVATKTREEMLANEATLQRVRESNLTKLNRDQMQQEVANAKASQLQVMRADSSAQLTAMRMAVKDPLIHPDDQRSMLQAIELEKQRIRLIDQRVAAEEKANATSTVANNAILDLKTRTARQSEQELLASAQLGTARARQADLIEKIAAGAERINSLTGKERSEAEQLLKLDQARLSVADKRVAQLENENRKLIEQAQPKPGTYGPPLPPGMKPPGSPTGGGSGPGIFGAAGLAGVVGRTLAYGTAYQVLFGAMGAAKQGVQDVIEFQDAVQKLGAIAGLTDTQMAGLAKTILEIGDNSRFSDKDLAEAATTLAQAGFSGQDIAASLKSISQLATAAGVEIKDATDVVTSAMGAFDLGADSAAHISDVLTVALNRTKLNLTQVAQGIQYAGATAHENNISFEELTATMAVMAQAGIKSGSTMGTGMREVLAKLIAPTKALSDELKHVGLSMKDIDVKTLGLPEVLNRLAQAGFTAADAYRAFGTRGAAAYLVLANNRQAINEEIIAQNQLGAAAQAAAKGQDSLAAEWQRSKNQALDFLNTAIAPLTRGLEDYLKAANDISGDSHVKELQSGILQGFMSGNGLAMAKAYGELQQYVGQLNDLNDAEAASADQIEATTTAINQATDEFNKHTDTLKSVDDATTRVYMHARQLKTDQVALAAETSTLTARFDGLAKYLDGAALSFDGLTAALRAYRLEELRLQGQALTTLVTQNRAAKGEHFSAADSIMAAARGDGVLDSLPANVRNLMARVAANPQNSILVSALSNMGEKLGDTAGKRFVEKWVSQVQQGVGAFTAASQAQKALDINGQLQTPKGVKLQSEVSALAGQPDSAIKAKIAQFANAMKGKSSSVQGAYMQLITQLQTMLGSGSPPVAPAGRTRHGGRGLGDRQDSAVDAERIKVDELQLKNAIKGLLDTSGSVGGTDSIVITKQRTLTNEQFLKNLDAVNKAFDDWSNDRRQQMLDQIKRLKLDPSKGKGAEMMQEVEDEIAAKKEETARQVSAEIAKMLDKMVTAAQEVASRAEEIADHSERMVEARLTALSRLANKGTQIPDYIQAAAERASARAKDQRDFDQIPINLKMLADLQQAFNDAAQRIDDMRAKGMKPSDDDLLKLTTLNDQIVKLKDNTEELQASFNTDGLIPRSFNDNLKMAIDNYREVNHLTASWTEMISMNLTDAFGTAQGAVADFINSVESGNATIGASFAQMVKSVIGYLSQLIAKMIAVKFMEMALNLFGGAASGASVDSSLLNPQVAGSLPGGLDANSVDAIFRLHGGEVHALTGRYIGDGVPNRDSVPARIARGEYVVRKSAVDSVGVDFMNRLNERGSMALQAMAPKIVLPPPSNQLMNVYVVAPDHQPTMGPNDVLVTIAEDIYRGGQTKQLIKQVAQGG